MLFARQWLDAQAPEEVVQDVFLRLMDQRPEDARAWLFRAVRNAAISDWRSRRRRARREGLAAGRGPAAFEPDVAARSPNVYWALADLPRPLLDVRFPLEMEGLWVNVNLPLLVEARDGRGSPERFNQAIRDPRTSFAEVAGRAYRT